MDIFKRKVDGKFKYEDVRMCLALKGIVLLTTKEEYNNMEGSKRVWIMCYCRHFIKDILLGSILHKNSGILCQYCVAKYQVVNWQIVKRQFNSINNSLIEGKSIEILLKYINKDFYYERTHESALYDLIIKPKNIKKDEWLPLQLKSTVGNYFMYYTFALNKIYKDCVIIFVTLCDERFWIFEDTNLFVNNHSHISIGIKKSKYSKFEVNRDNLSNKFLNIYGKHNNIILPKYQAIKPQSESSLIEFEYRVLREEKLNFLEFEYPITQYQEFDFKINGYKIQEKVGNQQDGNNFAYFQISRTLNRSKVKYDIGDNDYYWLHMPNKRIFYIIPEKALIDEGYVGNENKIKKLSIRVVDPKKYDEWYNKYEYKYDDLDKDKIILLFLPQKLNSDYLFSKLDKVIIKKKIELDRILSEKGEKERVVESNKCYCKECNNEIYRGGTYCRDCFKEYVYRKFNLSKEELEKLIFIEKLTFVKIGKLYNVSNTAVTKACNRLGINYKANNK